MPRTSMQNCTACGAPLNSPVQGGRIRCSFCGTMNLVEAQEKVKGDEILCPECGAANPKNANHCGRCGIKLEFNCPRCGALNSYGTVYCVQCGIDISGELKRQQEEEMRRQAEARRQQEEMLRQQEMERQKKARKRRISVVVTLSLLAGIVLCVGTLLGIGIYQVQFSPAARSTQTVLAMARTLTSAYNTLFQDNFSNVDSGWGNYTSDNGTMGYENGGFRVHITKVNWMMFSSLDTAYPGDIRIEVQATKIGGPDKNDFGIICRKQDNDNYLYLAITSDGYAAITKVTDGNYKIISSEDDTWTLAPDVNEGNKTNQIRADCIGSTVMLFVNGTRVATGEDAGYDGSSSYVGLGAGTYEEGGTDIQFDDIAIYRQ